MKKIQRQLSDSAGCADCSSNLDRRTGGTECLTKHIYKVPTVCWILQFYLSYLICKVQNVRDKAIRTTESAVTVKILKHNNKHLSAGTLSISLWCWNDRKFFLAFLVKLLHESGQLLSSSTWRQEIRTRKRDKSSILVNKQHHVPKTDHLNQHARSLSTKTHANSETDAQQQPDSEMITTF